MGEGWVAAADARRDDEPHVDRRARAAVLTAMSMGIPILHEHLSRALGVDLSSPEGDRRLTLALLDLYSHQWMSPDEAESARAGLRREEDRHE